MKMSTIEHDWTTFLAYLWLLFNILFYPILCMFIDRSDIIQCIKDCATLNFDWHKEFIK